jgi:hypothetical protein
MFYDLSGDLITNYRFMIEFEDQQTMSLKILCSAKILKCTPAPDLIVEGRHSGNITWVDLETTGISLSPWDGDIEIFEVRFTATSGTVRQLDEFSFYLA